MKKNHLGIFISGAVLIGVLFTSCKKSFLDDNNNTEVAGLEAFNLAPDKTIGITISNNELTSSPLAFTNYTGGYMSIYPGNRSVRSYDYPSGDSLATTASYTFETKKYYSLFVLGASGAYQNVIVNDNFDSLSASSGQAYLRYVNAISGPAAVTISAGGNNVVNDNAAFANVSDFVAVTPGDVTIAVSGANANANRTITTEAKKVYTILLLPGATSTDAAQVKYIVNGTLTDEAGQRVSSSSRTEAIK